MINKNKWQQYGKEGLIPTCITIHNTNNYEMKAKEYINYYENECFSFNACHYIVDYEGIVGIMPTNWKVWHTGKGNDYAFNHSLAIEICNNLDDDLYLKGQDIAIKLIKELMKKFNMSKDDIYFHKDWNDSTYCPNAILDLYGNKKNFIEKFF